MLDLPIKQAFCDCNRGGKRTILTPASNYTSRVLSLHRRYPLDTILKKSGLLVIPVQYLSEYAAGARSSTTMTSPPDRQRTTGSRRE